MNFNQGRKNSAKTNFVQSKERGKNKKGLNFNIGLDIKPKDLQIIVRQLSILIDAGVPLSEGLGTLSRSGRSQDLSDIIKKVKLSIDRGKTFSASLAEHPKVFDSIFVNLIKAGEEGGVLAKVLRNHAVFLEKSLKMQSAVKGAMVYPIAILCVAGIAITAILIFVIPTFASMFAGMGKDLPALTQMVLDFSGLIRTKGHLLILGMVAIGIMIKSLMNNQSSKKQIDAIVLEIPVLGNFLTKAIVAKSFRILSVLLEAGVDILRGLEIASSLVNNSIIKKIFTDAQKNITAGKPLYSAFENSPYLDIMVVDMMKTGEGTGRLDYMLGKICDFYDDELEIASETMLKMIEPILLVVLGGIVGFLVVAMYLPIFGMAGGAG
ncbi:MAG: type II secretion system F family protein [Bdellovibrionaceae bacterium]|nr:type II secretion system F family protein [Pseudobdellovibrionaceae bacterium]